MNIIALNQRLIQNTNVKYRFIKLIDTLNLTPVSYIEHSYLYKNTEPYKAITTYISGDITAMNQISAIFIKLKLMEQM